MRPSIAVCRLEDIFLALKLKSGRIKQVMRKTEEEIRVSSPVKLSMSDSTFVLP